MSSFLEQYGVAIFTLVLVAILIAFAGPLGMKIKNATTDKVSQTEQIGKDEITVATGGVVRPEEPAEAVDNVYCIYYDDGEMTISQNEIEPEAGRTVVKKGFFTTPYECSYDMTTVRFVDAVKPKNCDKWFAGCIYLTEIKNIENLYTNECVSMGGMFYECTSLTSLDLSNFDISKVTYILDMFYNCINLTSLDVSGFDTSQVNDMSFMFSGCSSLTNLDVSGFDTSNVENMQCMFNGCFKLTSLDVSNFDTSNVINMSDMFADCKSLTSLNLSNFDITKVRLIYSSNIFLFCSSLEAKSVKVSQATYDKLKTVSNLGITADKFDIVK